MDSIPANKCLGDFIKEGSVINANIDFDQNCFEVSEDSGQITQRVDLNT